MKNVKQSAGHVITLCTLLLLSLWSTLAHSKSYTDKDLKCLTDNIYWESQGEPVLGMVWVAKSVLDRKEDRRWEDTICGVVYEPKQYSWTSEPSKPIRYTKAYKLSQEVATAALEGRIDVPELNHYLRCDWMEKPNTWWWKKMNFVGQIGHHCFFND